MNCWKNYLFSVTFLFISVTSFSQIKFRALPSVGGTSLGRGGEFEYIVQANGNGNSSTKQLVFDIQYDLTNFELVSVNHTGTGGNGGILPQGSTISLSHYDYNGYSFVPNAANTTANGTTNYYNSNYQYNNNMSSSILRVTLNWATNSTMPYGSYDRMIVVKFRLKANSTAYTFNPIKLNFVAGWNGNGQQDATIMESPLSTPVYMNQNYGKYVSAKVDVNSNLYALSNLKVSFYDTVAKTGQLFNVTSTGDVDINQNLLAANKVYDVTVMYEMDKIYSIYNSAITISDFTNIQKEFTQNGLELNGDFGNILNTGQSYFAGDINRNQQIDAGDLPRLLAQVVGLDTLFKLPSTYTTGTGGYMSMPTWKAAEINTIAGETEWGYVTPSSTGTSKLYIDMRKFPSGVTPNTYSSVQLFDLYTGPMEFESNDATWAIYKIPSTLAKVTDGTSTYVAYIRNINGGPDYGLMVEFDFTSSPSEAWGAVTKSNWKTMTMPHAYFKTGTLGTNAVLNLKYLLWADVNRSHSSQVVTSTNGSAVIKTNAIPSLQMNMAFNEVTGKMAAATTGPFVNTLVAYTSIDVNIPNVTVTSNNFEIPVSVDTKGNKVTGLQLEFSYNPNLVKFEEMATAVPNGWYIFANTKEGVVKFGALDQNKQESIIGVSTPFKLKFSTIGAGVDVATSVKVSSVMDASDVNGNQLGINLNSTQIKLTGYNNF
jgi:hypothetical protein